MSMAVDLRTYLLTSVVEVVGEKVFQNYASEGTVTPYVIYGRNGKDTDITLDGAKGLAKSTFVIECRGTSPSEAEDLGDLVDDLLNGTSGTWGDSVVQGSFVSSVDDSYVPFPAASDQAEHTVAMSVEIWHQVDE